jgi:hypothetical protein
VELDAVDGVLAVTEAHDFFFGGFGGDFEDIRDGVATHDEGMVAGCIEWRGETGEDSFAIVQDGRGFAVHEPLRAHDGPAKDIADALMAQTDSEDGSRRAESADYLV